MGIQQNAALVVQGFIHWLGDLFTKYPHGALFNTYAFLLVFLPVTLVGYWIVPSRTWKLAWLTVASLVFYSFYDIRFTALFLAAAAVDFMVALRMQDAAGRRRKALLGISLAFNLGLLAVFKYAGFADRSAQSLFHLLGLRVTLPGIEIALPVGISFFTFKTLSYTLDVYWGHVEATRSPLKYVAFVSLFPDMVAGPIVRYRVLSDQLSTLPARLDSQAVTTALSFLTLGLIKKVLIADPIAHQVSGLWQDPGALSSAAAWTAALGYTLQIYFDFSGYSDMALGLAGLLGLQFPVNFRGPYQARNPSDFWQRWHITLSSFLRDYLYIPLGGNRGSRRRTLANLMVVMLLGGLWHGAAWTFVIWGAYHGMILVAYHLRKGQWDAWPQLVQRAIMFLLVVIGWVIFRAGGPLVAARVLQHMFFPWGPWGAGSFVASAGGAIPLLAGVGLLFMTWLVRPTTDRAYPDKTWWLAALGAGFAFTLMAVSAGNSPFLYYQF